MQRLDADLIEKARRRLRRRDPVLGALIRRVGRCHMRSRSDPYRALLRSVVYQQLHGRAAAAIDARLRRPHRGRYPRPEVLVATPLADLRAAGLSARKAETLKGVAHAFAEGGLSSRRLRRMEEAEVIEAVTAVKGIGEWTAHMLLMFTLARPDILPVGDYGIRKGAMSLYGLKALPDRRELEALAQPWRPYRSVASWYLWRQADAAAPE